MGITVVGDVDDVVRDVDGVGVLAEDLREATRVQDSQDPRTSLCKIRNTAKTEPWSPTLAHIKPNGD